MKNNTKEEKNTLTKLFNFTTYILDYIYKDISAIPKDFLTEVHLRFFKHNKDSNKKILGYWDFNQRLSKLGDFIAFLEMLNILRIEWGLNHDKKNIDICFIDDNKHYNTKQIRYSKSYWFKKNLQSLATINPFINSVFIFHSNKEFERFYQQNRTKYIRWPSTISGTVPIDYRRIEQFYKEKKYIPLLTIPTEIITEVNEFYKLHVYPALPIILHLRKNKHSPERNSNLSEIKNFLKHYEKNESYRFIIICDKSEIPEEFRTLKNIFFSKDYFNDIEIDLAFIKTSYFSIFPSSGMACFACFSKIPFIGYGKYIYKEKYTSPHKKKHFAFLSKYQRIYHTSETSEWLISKFEEMVNYLKKNNINNTESNVKPIKLRNIN